MQIEHETDANRFVAALPSGAAVLAYAPAGEKIVDFYSTFVPPASRGQGVAAQLVAAGMAWARGEGLRVIPSCWYVALWLRQHPEHQDLLAPR